MLSCAIKMCVFYEKQLYFIRLPTLLNNQMLCLHVFCEIKTFLLELHITKYSLSPV